MDSTQESSGISFLTAMKMKYADIFTAEEDVLHLPQNEGKDRSIELIGFDTVSKVQRNFERLIEVSLPKMNISYCGTDCNQMIETLSQTKTLILSNNSLNSWLEISKIIKNIKSLTDLVLSYNKLKVPLNEEIDSDSFKTIKVLIMDNIDYDWNHVQQCAQLWPQIERLDLWGNQIVELKTPEQNIFQNLKSLSLCNNKINSWNQICKLGYLPELKILDVSNCGLSEIRFENTDYRSKTGFFNKLENLIINSNNITNWRDVSELNKLENLENLFIKNNPVFDNEKYDTNFNLILARFEKLKVLNRETITKQMRREAEICYLRMFYKDFIALNIGSNEEMLARIEFLNSNPRFEQILQQYGPPFGTETVSKAELNEKRFLTVSISNPLDEKNSVEKKLPVTLSIVNLKAIIRRMFKIDFNYEISLLWISKGFQCPLDKETQNLNFYSIENGDTIQVIIQ